MTLKLSKIWRSWGIDINLFMGDPSTLSLSLATFKDTALFFVFKRTMWEMKSCISSILKLRGHLSPLHGMSTFYGKMLYYSCKYVNITQSGTGKNSGGLVNSNKIYLKEKCHKVIHTWILRKTVFWSFGHFSLHYLNHIGTKYG